MEDYGKMTIIDAIEVDDKKLPNIIAGKYNEIAKLERKYKDSKARAEAAKKFADEIAEKGVKFFNKREIIENIQEAEKSIADAVASLAEAQEKQFEYEKKLTDACKYLFLMGATNMANNQSIRRELQLRLTNASEEELSEFAQQEIINTINQLKEQEKIMEKQTEVIRELEKHESKLKEINSDIIDIKKFIKDVDSYQHLKDIDNMWSEAEQYKINIKNIKEDIENKNRGINHRSDLLSERLSAIEENKHLMDIDELWSDNQKQKDTNDNVLKSFSGVNDRILDICNDIDVDKKGFEQEMMKMYKKSKIACYALGTTSAVAIILSVLNLLKII